MRKIVSLKEAVNVIREYAYPKVEFLKDYMNFENFTLKMLRGNSYGGEKGDRNLFTFFNRIVNRRGFFSNCGCFM